MQNEAEIKGFEKAMDLLKVLANSDISEEQKITLTTAFAFLHWKKKELFGRVIKAESTLKEHLDGCKETNS